MLGQLREHLGVAENPHNPTVGVVRIKRPVRYSSKLGLDRARLGDHGQPCFGRNKPRATALDN